MTLQPVPDRILSWDFDEDEFVLDDLGPLCAVPSCPARGVQGHHICPRRQTCGPRRLVAVNGQVVDNVAMLCNWHHDMVTGGLGGHKARIQWNEYAPGGWVWSIPEGDDWSIPVPLELRRGRHD